MPANKGYVDHISVELTTEDVLQLMSDLPPDEKAHLVVFISGAIPADGGDADPRFSWNYHLLVYRKARALGHRVTWSQAGDVGAVFQHSDFWAAVGEWDEGNA